MQHPRQPYSHPEFRLFTARDANVDSKYEVHPTARLLHDSLPQHYRDVFENCPMYPEKHLEFVKFLKYMSQTDVTEVDVDLEQLKSLGIQIPTEEGDKKKWQCGVVGCDFKDTLQHLYTHLQSKHLKLPMYSCQYCKKTFNRRRDRDRHEVKIHPNNSNAQTSSLRSKRGISYHSQLPKGRTEAGKNPNGPEKRPPAYNDAVHNEGVSTTRDTLSSYEGDDELSARASVWSPPNSVEFDAFHQADTNKPSPQDLSHFFDPDGAFQSNQEPFKQISAAQGPPVAAGPILDSAQFYGYGNGRYNLGPAGRQPTQSQMMFADLTQQNTRPATPPQNGLMSILPYPRNVYQMGMSPVTPIQPMEAHLIGIYNQADTNKPPPPQDSSYFFGPETASQWYLEQKWPPVAAAPIPDSAQPYGYVNGPQSVMSGRYNLAHAGRLPTQSQMFVADPTQQNTRPATNDTVFYCEYCKKSFNRIDDRDQHEVEMHQPVVKLIPGSRGDVQEGPSVTKQTPSHGISHGNMDLDALEPEPYIAGRFGVRVPNLSSLVRRSERGTIFVGTYSSVYPGMYQNEKVAIKVLRMAKDSDTTQRRFRRELFIWWNLRHVNVLPLYGYFENNDGEHVLPSLISKWAERGSAAQYIHQDLSWYQRTRLLYDVAEGLKYLHGFEPLIVHADLKPQNVLVDKDGIGQLCDFGLTRFMETGLDTGLTTTTAHTGTTRYLAYELVEYDSDEPIPTTATDMYALGCLALEFIHRVPPHASLRRNIGRITRAIGDGVPPAKRPTNPEEAVPILWDLLEACWSNAPEERPTATEVSDYLERNIQALLEGLRHCTWAPEYPTP